jgi:predicted dehydrogenase
MAPIRVGLIGLSGQPREKRDGISWAEIAHLQYFRSTAEYQIRALLNSSVESARAAIQRHKLATNTKAYGDPNGTLASLLLNCSLSLRKKKNNMLANLFLRKLNSSRK